MMTRPRRDARSGNAYDLPLWIIADSETPPDYGGRLGMFLTLNAESCLGRWSGYMLAADQRALCGRYLGRGRLVIDGARANVSMTVTVNYGQDVEFIHDIPFHDL